MFEKCLNCARAINLIVIAHVPDVPGAPEQPYEVSRAFPVPKQRRSTLREVKELARGHTAPRARLEFHLQPVYFCPLSHLRHRHKQEPGEDHRNWGQGPWGSTTCQLSHGCPREPWSPSKMEGMHTMGEGPGAWPTPRLRPSGAGAWHTPQTRRGVPGRAAPRPFRGCERQEAGSCLHLRTLVPSPVWWPETDTGNAGRRVKGALALA